MKRRKWKKLGAFALSFVLAMPVSYYPGTVLASQTETEMTEGKIETEPESTELELQTESTAPETEAAFETQPESQLPEMEQPLETEQLPETIEPETEQPSGTQPETIAPEPEQSSETQTEDSGFGTEDFTDGTEAETSQPGETEGFTDNPVSETLSEFFNSGISTQEDTVSISNAAELRAFRDRVNGGEYSLNAALTADVDLQNESWGDGIGKGAEYTGTFDGNGHTITNANVNGYQNGFFDLIGSGGTVCNLGIYGSINGNEVGFVSGNFGTIENCAVYLNITATGMCNGGIAGYNEGAIRHCIYGGQISTSTESGAIVGWQEGTVTNCYYVNQNSGVEAFGSGNGSAGVKSSDQFASGEIAWLLNGSSSEGIWKQTIGTDNYPNFTGETVYKKSDGTFSNTQADSVVNGTTASPIKKAARTGAVRAAVSDTSIWFAEAKDLLTAFDTDNSTQDKPGKMVYFGQNGQKWWIVGQDPVGSGLVLFAASSLGSVMFSSSDGERMYEGATVYANHYGASDLIKTLKGLETNTAYFSAAEQGLMVDTTVYTDDRRNGWDYSTMGKLYAAYGDYYDNRYVTAGTNSSGNLNGGLRIDTNYYGNSAFWLRAPLPKSGLGGFVLVAPTSGVVSNDLVNSKNSVVPAFQLNLSSVLFASAAPAAVSEGTLTTEDTFTLRYTPNSSLGTAALSKSKACVAISNVSDNTYLVAQNANGAWAKKVSDGDVIFASGLDSSLTSFADCKVWLEKTDSASGLTYAAKATESQETGYYVKINAGQNMNLQSGNSTQQNVAGKIEDIIYKAVDGYYFPNDYSVAGTNGLVITVSSDNKSITISGTPTDDTLLTLTDAPQIPKAPTPSVTRASGSASTLTITPLEDTATYGEARYSINNGDTWQEANVFTNLKAGHTYTVLAKYLGKGIYTESETGTGSIPTDSADYTISIPATAQAGGSSVEIKVDTGQKFDLGYNGQVNVKVQAGVSAGGTVTLTRQNDPENKTVTSAMHVNGKQFPDISKAIVAFDMNNYTKESREVSFAKPTENNIPAGTYTGTVTFEITYSEQ